MSKRTRGETREANKRRESHARKVWAPVGSPRTLFVMAAYFGRSVAMEMAPVGVRKRHLELVRAAKRRWRRSRERLVCTGQDVVLRPGNPRGAGIGVGRVYTSRHGTSLRPVRQEQTRPAATRRQATLERARAIGAQEDAARGQGGWRHVGQQRRGESSAFILLGNLPQGKMAMRQRGLPGAAEANHARSHLGSRRGNRSQPRRASTEGP